MKSPFELRIEMFPFDKKKLNVENQRISMLCVSAILTVFKQFVCNK